MPKLIVFADLANQYPLDLESYLQETGSGQIQMSAVDELLEDIYRQIESSGVWSSDDLESLAGPSNNVGEAPSKLAQYLRRQNFQLLADVFYQNLTDQFTTATDASQRDDIRDKILDFLNAMVGVITNYDPESEDAKDLNQGLKNDATLNKAKDNLADTSVIDPAADAFDVYADLEEYQIPNLILAALSNTLSKLIELETEVENVLFVSDPVLSQVYANILGQLRTQPPSGAIAGIYNLVDDSRGVFKAPANVSLTGISSPSFLIDDQDQESMNVHPSGKSVNAIRSFVNKGTLVWGARTLDGNSNEWRYVSVRRYFIFVEESIQEALEPFVFEPNDINTWTRIRAMITNFLLNQWRSGALFGASLMKPFLSK